MRSWPVLACTPGPCSAAVQSFMRFRLPHALLALAPLRCSRSCRDLFPSGRFVDRDGDRKGEVDRGALVHVQVQPDPAAMVFDDLLDDGEPDAGALVRVPRMQPL